MVPIPTHLMRSIAKVSIPFVLDRLLFPKSQTLVVSNVLVELCLTNVTQEKVSKHCVCKTLIFGDPLFLLISIFQELAVIYLGYILVIPYIT